MKKKVAERRIRSLDDKEVRTLERGLKMFVKDCVTPNPITVGPEEDVKNAFSLLNKHGFRQLPVVKDGKLVGIVFPRDHIITTR